MKPVVFYDYKLGLNPVCKMIIGSNNKRDGTLYVYFQSVYPYRIDWAKHELLKLNINDYVFAKEVIANCRNSGNVHITRDNPVPVYLYIAKSNRHNPLYPRIGMIIASKYTYEELPAYIVVYNCPSETYLFEKEELIPIDEDMLLKAINVGNLMDINFTEYEGDVQKLYNCMSSRLMINRSIWCSFLNDYDKIYFNICRLLQRYRQIIQSGPGNCSLIDISVRNSFPQNIMDFLSELNERKILDYYIEYITGKKMTNNFVFYKLKRMIKEMDAQRETGLPLVFKF